MDRRTFFGASVAGTAGLMVSKQVVAGDKVTLTTADEIQTAIDSGIKVIDLQGEKVQINKTININAEDVTIQNASFEFHESYNIDAGDLNFFKVTANNARFINLNFNMKFATEVGATGNSYGISFFGGVKKGLVSHCNFVDQELRSLASVSVRSGAKQIRVESCRFETLGTNRGGGGVLISGNECHVVNCSFNNLRDASLSLDTSLGSVATGNIFRLQPLNGSTILADTGAVAQIAHGSQSCIFSDNTFIGIPTVGLLLFNTVEGTPNQSFNRITNNVFDGGGYIDKERATLFIRADQKSSNNVFSGNTFFNPSGRLRGSAYIDLYTNNNIVSSNIIQSVKRSEVFISAPSEGASPPYSHEVSGIRLRSGDGDIQITSNTFKVSYIGIKVLKGDYSKCHIKITDNLFSQCEEAIDSGDPEVIGFSPYKNANQFVNVKKQV